MFESLYRELTQEERRKLNSEELVYLAVVGYKLSTEDRDRLDAEQLFHLATSKIITLSASEREKLSSRQRMLLVNAGLLWGLD
jgi:hypothetical protein